MEENVKRLYKEVRRSEDCLTELHRADEKLASDLCNSEICQVRREGTSSSDHDMLDWQAFMHLILTDILKVHCVLYVTSCDGKDRKILKNIHRPRYLKHRDQQLQEGILNLNHHFITIITSTSFVCRVTLCWRVWWTGTWAWCTSRGTLPRTSGTSARGPLSTQWRNCRGSSRTYRLIERYKEVLQKSQIV